MHDEKGLIPNVDFFSATVYHSMEIPHDILHLSLCKSYAGWTAHILEQYRDNRIIRPRAKYVGETNRKYVAVEKDKIFQNLIYGGFYNGS